LPVFYLAFIYGKNPSIDRFGFRYGFATTSFAALVGQSMFFLGYESIKSSMYFPKVIIRETSYVLQYLILFPLFTCIWLSRGILLYKGSYYHIYRTEFQFTSIWYSVCIQLSEFGLIIVIALFLMAFSENKKDHKKKIIIAITVFISEVLWYVPAGSRSEIAMLIIAGLLSFVIIKRKLSLRLIAIIAFIGIPFFAIYDNYRYTISHYVAPSEINISVILPALIDSRYIMIKQEYNIITKTMERAYDGQSLNYLLMNYSSDYDYEMGNTFLNIPFVVIPRFIYPDKPTLVIPLNYWYNISKGGSSPITFWGESYINFSWFGIFIMSFLLGICMKGYDFLFLKMMSNQYWLCLYVFGAVFILLKLSMHAAVISLAMLIHVIVLAFIFSSLYKFFLKIANRKKAL
jgi:hypothetical protein